MENMENAAIAEKTGPDSNQWILAARQSLLARQRKKQFRRKQKALWEEQNEQFRRLVRHGR